MERSHGQYMENISDVFGHILISLSCGTYDAFSSKPIETDRLYHTYELGIGRS